MKAMAILKLLLKNKDTLFKAVLGLSVAFLIAYGTIVHNANKNLTERLGTALNNIEAYQGIVNQNNDKNNVLRLTVDELKRSNDSLLQQLDSVNTANSIKRKDITTSATQTQYIYVTGDKGVQGDLIEILKDTVYNDSIQYNELTTVYYTIGSDSVSIAIDLKNTQYLTTYKKKEYKNKKSFIKRLFTLDFKKVYKYKYYIINTNDLINTSDVRVVEITQ